MEAELKSEDHNWFKHPLLYYCVGIKSEGSLDGFTVFSPGFGFKKGFPLNANHQKMALETSNEAF